MFHDTRFPTSISRAAHGGPERRTDVVVLGSGAEERNARWANSRRSLIGFRWRDHADWKSCPPENTPTALDQQIGVGNGTATTFQLTKTYGSAFNPWTRDIKKPVVGTILVAVDGVLQTPTTAYTA